MFMFMLVVSSCAQIKALYLGHSEMLSVISRFGRAWAHVSSSLYTATSALRAFWLAHDGRACDEQPQKQIYAKFKTIFSFINFINSKRRLRHVAHICPPPPLPTYSTVRQWSLVNLLASNINLSGVFFFLSHLWDQIVSINFIVCAHTQTHTTKHQLIKKRKPIRILTVHTNTHTHTCNNKVLNYKSFSVGSTKEREKK